MTRRSRVRALICEHPRERIFVQPLEWTPRHLELLDCSFQQDDTASDGEVVVVIEENKEDEKRVPDRWTKTAKLLVGSELKTATIKKLLADGDGPLKFLR